MVKMAKRGGTFTALALAAAMALGAGSVAVVAPPEQAAAVTEYEYQQKVSNHNSLKKQLTGVDSKLADLIISLNDLTENQIPAAQKAVQEAQQKAEQAKSLAEATTARLEAARKLPRLGRLHPDGRGDQCHHDRGLRQQDAVGCRCHTQ